MLKAIIFDMDGVLVDTPVINWEVINSILQSKYKIKISFSEIKEKYLGKPLNIQFQEILSDHNISNKEDYRSFVEEHRAKCKEMFKGKLMPNEGIIKLITLAKENNIKVAVATSSSKERAKRILRYIGIIETLDIMLCREDVTKHKPDPKVYLETAKRLTVDPKECVVFEDALNGITAAQRAGMKVIGKVTKFNNADELSHTDLVIENFSEITLENIENLFS